MRILAKVLPAVVLGSLLMVGCGDIDASGVRSSSLANPQLGDGTGMSDDVFFGIATDVYKLDQDFRHIVNPACDQYTRLVMQSNESEALVFLSNRVDGSCDLTVAESPRLFQLQGESYGCGSILYTGEALPPSEGVVQSENPSVSLEVIDHRNRVCKDRVAAPLIITEKYADGSSMTFYSRPVAVVQ